MSAPFDLPDAVWNWVADQPDLLEDLLQVALTGKAPCVTDDTQESDEDR